MNRKPACWGIYREIAHSPGRETDDAEILRSVAAELSGRGFAAELKAPDELPENRDAAEIPRSLFVMCERAPVVERLAAWERQGVCVVNRPEAIRNTDRERTIARFARYGVPSPPSVLVPTAAPPDACPVRTPCWVKRGDVHATEPGDVSFAAGATEIAAALARLSARGIAHAVLQEHVPGDLIKFYGVAGIEDGGPASWFQWFYHRDQVLRNCPLDPAALTAAAVQGAAALGLEVFGGDAIATEDGRVLLIDLNAWPSFALYRKEAAASIAALLQVRFLQRAGVAR